MPRFFALVNAGAIPTVMEAGAVQVSPELFAAHAAAWGVSMPAWATFNTLLNILSALVFTLVAALVWWRLRTWFGWLTAMVLLVGGSNVQNNVIRTAMIWPPAYFIWTVGALIWPLLVLWLYLFPDGRPVPRRLLWIVGPLVALFASLFLVILIAETFPGFTAAVSLIPAINRIAPALVFPLIFLTLGAQIYRYLRCPGQSHEAKQSGFSPASLWPSLFPISSGCSCHCQMRSSPLLSWPSPWGSG